MFAIVKLCINRVPRTALAPRCTLRLVLRIRIAALNHESSNDSVKSGPIVETLFGELLEIFNGLPLLSSKTESSHVVMCTAHFSRLEDFEDDDDIPVLSGRGEGIMDEVPATGSGHARRNEDIALDLMKFVAMTTGYGRTTSTGVGFTGSGSAAKPEDYADKLLELYGRCLGAVTGKK